MNAIATGTDFSKINATTIARAINILFGNAKMFGPEHPSTENAAKDLSKIISASAGINPLISFIRQGKSFYVEKWLIDGKINHSRFMSDFEKLSIESISFANGVSVKSIMVFIKTFIYALENRISADKIQVILAKKNENEIVLNYIVFQKVAKGEKVVEADAQIQAPQSVISHLEELFKIQDTIDGNTFVNELNSVQLKINEEKETGEINYDLLFDALINASEIVKKTEFLLKEDEEKIISQIDKMTTDAILGIIKNEISQQRFSIKKLVFLIKRLDPSKEELQILLPQIKTAMLDAGLNISDYLDFVADLGDKLNEEKAIDKILDNAKDFGVKPQEIIDAFSQNPQECVKLLLQAEEIRKQIDLDGKDLSGYLSTMLDDISRNNFNLSPAEITKILENASRHKKIREQKKDLQILPPKTTVHFIKRYIEEYKRHQHPFSIILISDKNANASKAETVSIAEKAAFLLSESFRILDIAGVVRFRGKDVAVIILPMTTSDGLNKVMEKILSITDSQKQLLSSISYELPNKSEPYEVVMNKLLCEHI